MPVQCPHFSSTTARAFRIDRAIATLAPPLSRSLSALAPEASLTPAQLALGWVLAKQPTLVPVVGARTRVQLDDALGALEKPLGKADIAALEAMLPTHAIAGQAKKTPPRPLATPRPPTPSRPT